MNYCEHCKYYKRYPFASATTDDCLHDNNKSPVDKQPMMRLLTLRLTDGLCGPEGKWFEPKEEK